MRKVVESLFCDFTAEELEQKGQELSSAMLHYDDVESKKKEATTTFGDELKSIRGQMRGLSNAIRKKGETRPVECVVNFNNPVIGLKRIVRADTGELVREEPMTSTERQQNLFGEIDTLGRMWGNGPEGQTEGKQPEA